MTTNSISSKGSGSLVASDSSVLPKYIPDLVHATLDLLIDEEEGLLHLTNEGQVSWAELTKQAVEQCSRLKANIHLDAKLIVERKMDELGLPARRPKLSALASERVRMLPPLNDALQRYFSQLEVHLHGGLQ